MNAEEIISSINWVSFLVGIFSLSLSIIAIVLSFKWYQLGKDSSDEISNSVNEISTKSAEMEKLSDKMFNQLLQMVWENSKAWQSVYQESVGKTNLQERADKSDNKEMTSSEIEELLKGV